MPRLHCAAIRRACCCLLSGVYGGTPTSHVGQEGLAELALRFPESHGRHVLRNYLKNKASCAIVSVSQCIRNALRDDCVHLDYMDTRRTDR